MAYIWNILYLWSLNVVVYYDDAFHQRFSSNVNIRITAIMDLVDEQFSESSFKTKLNVITKDIQHAAGYNWEELEWQNQCPSTR